MNIYSFQLVVEAIHGLNNERVRDKPVPAATDVTARRTNDSGTGILVLVLGLSYAQSNVFTLYVSPKLIWNLKAAI